MEKRVEALRGMFDGWSPDGLAGAPGVHRRPVPRKLRKGCYKD